MCSLRKCTSRQDIKKLKTPSCRAFNPPKMGHVWHWCLQLGGRNDNRTKATKKSRFLQISVSENEFRFRSRSIGAFYSSDGLFMTQNMLEVCCVPCESVWNRWERQKAVTLDFELTSPKSLDFVVLFCFLAITNERLTLSRWKYPIRCRIECSRRCCIRFSDTLSGSAFSEGAHHFGTMMKIT